jgi:hypothetical protein
MRWTEDGPVIIPINSTTNCRPPVDGKPNISCTADPFITISSTLSSFTLPSSVTQKPGSCIVSFSAAADVCKDKIPDRTDTISITPGVCDNKITDPKDPKFCGPNECDPTISDYADARYCPRTVTKGVCVEIKNYSTGSIVSVLGPVKSNPYFEKYNPGKDATIYQE